jgi:thioredoxin-related protein
MKSFLLVIIFLSLPFLAKGQEGGIKFESGLSWKEIQSKARAENKYIFMDCYATWCGPCKLMDRNIYSQKEVGDFFNANFISVAVQMDKTLKDAQSVQLWYSDAATLNDNYAIGAYPTFLFFSPDGIIRHRVVGSTQDGSEFITKAKDAINPEKQYYTLFEQRKCHKNDSVALLHDLISAIDAEDKVNMGAITDDYISCLRNPLTIDNIKLISQVINSSKDKGFKLFLDNLSKIEELRLDRKNIENKLTTIIYEDEIAPLFLHEYSTIDWGKITTELKVKYPELGDNLIKRTERRFQNSITHDIKNIIYKQATPHADWVNISKELKKRYPRYDINRILLEKQAEYYEHNKLWSGCEETAFILLTKYGNELDGREINNITWDYVFTHSRKKKILFEALRWMKHTINESPDQFNNLDTYANLLYKTGQTKEAIVWENKAIKIAEKSDDNLQDIKEFKETIEKMKRGEKTWID